MMLQRDPKHFLQPLSRSTWASWTEITRNNGYTALWRGNVPSMLRVGMGAGMYDFLLFTFFTCK